MRARRAAHSTIHYGPWYISSMTSKHAVIVAALCATPWSSLCAETFLPSIFTEHMVVQQKTPLKVFGKDNPGQKVAVTFQDQTAIATADQNGKWQLTVAVPQAGGPYQLAVGGSSSHTFTDVLVGEVWICSGQSNMQFGMSGVLNAGPEIAAADFPQIRLFNVPNVRNLQPQENVNASWQVCSPKTVPGFSAVGYFFGRQLHQDLKVPVGLINASWGGTAAEAWTPREELITLPGQKEALDDVSLGQEKSWKKYGAAMNVWLAKLDIRNEGGEKEKAGWANSDFDDATWKTMALPTPWQQAGENYNGIVWFRKTIDIPADAKLDGAASIELGGIDDFDVTFINGKQIGSTDASTPSFWNAPRKYTIPAGVLLPGKNVIAVRVVDFGGSGGFMGDAASMKLTIADKSIALSGDWKFALEKTIVIPGDSSRPADPAGNNMATELFNAMVNPYVGYPIAGVIWYQGETNAGNPGFYRQLLPTMVKAWRDRWNSQFTFLVVQLAGFMHDSGNPSDAPGWATFRDCQREICEKTPKFGLAVAIDIGNADDIHPKNKQDVGKRLALQALKVAYGKDVVASGPTIKSAKVQDAKVILSFDNVGADLMAKQDVLANNFAMLDKNGTWVWADAAIVDNTVVLSSPQVQQPTMVRYAWQNSPAASLYNKDNLPAVPFQIEVK